MKYTKTTFLPEFRGPGCCEHCGRWDEHRQCHHVIAKGRGGANTLSLPINLVAVCGKCHRDIQGRVPLGARLVARREGLHPEFVERRLWQLVRAPKGCTPCLRCLGCGTIKLWKLRHGGVFSRYACVCGGVGILDAAGEPWQEPERVFH